MSFFLTMRSSSNASIRWLYRSIRKAHILKLSFVFVPDRRDLVTTHSRVMHYWLHEVILVSVAYRGPFSSASVEIALPNVSIRLITWSFCAFKTRRLGEFNISIYIEYLRLAFLVFGAESLHAGTRFEGWKDDIILLKDCQCGHRIYFFTSSTFFLTLSNPIFNLTPFWF